MKLNDPGDNRITPKMVFVVLGVMAVFALIVIIALVPNLTGGKKSKEDGEIIQNPGLADGIPNVVAPEPASPGEGLFPTDLDFWDMYPADSGNTQPVVQTPAEPVTEPDDPATDGKHTLVTLRDGTEEWVLISQYLPKNDFDSTKLVCKDSEMQYFVDGRQESYWGIDVSKYQDYIDFAKVKKAGIDFVMIRVGLRGYGTGQISMDDYFYDNIKRATDAGLKVGVYFSSQAISLEEVIEEATIVLDAVKDYEITYPIAFDMGFVKNDTARIESVSKSDKTTIAKAFLDSVNAMGYTGMLYGNKEWLIKEVDMSKLTAYDVWLAQPGDLPDYPYKFSMWQYRTNGSIDGVSGYVNLNVSFVDYSEK